MAYVFRRPWRRATQPRAYTLSKKKAGSAANTIAPFVSAANAHVVEVGSAANLIDPFISAGVAFLGLVASAAETIGPFPSAGVGVVYDAHRIPGTEVGAVNECLQAIIPSYLYQQYANDDDLQAFVASYNNIAQLYLAWLNAVELPVYTGALLVGDLLDWVALGLYGVARPALSAGNISTLGPFDTYHLDEMAFAARRTVGPAVFTPLSDDFFKRVLTWKLFKGDGKYIDVRWLKRRIVRFLFGADGGDVNAANTQQISVTFGGNIIDITVVNNIHAIIQGGPLYNARRFNEMGYNVSSPSVQIKQTIVDYQHDNQININFLSHVVTKIAGTYFNTFAGNSAVFNGYRPTAISTFPPLPNTAIFKQAVDQGVLDLPFQFKFVVNIR